MKKNIILLIISVFLFASCISDGTSSATESSEENTHIEMSSPLEEDISISGLTYILPEYRWNEGELSSTQHVYYRGGDFNTVLCVAYQTPINIETILGECVEEIRESEHLTRIAVENGVFQIYPCVYVTVTYEYDFDTTNNPQVKTNFHQYILFFVANNGLYTVQITTPSDLSVYIGDFNEIIDSIVITPI